MKFWGWVGDQVAVAVGMALWLGLSWLTARWNGWDFDRVVLWELLWFALATSWRQYKREHPLPGERVS